MSKLKWLVAGLAAVAVAVVGGTWVYINVLSEDPPPPLSLDSSPDQGSDTTEGSTTGDVTTTTAPVDALSLDGEWSVTSGSEVGYRVGEVIFGQSTEGVGRTDQVIGGFTLTGTTVSAATFEADMASVRSDESRRDEAFRERIMDVATHPKATLVLTEPIELGEDPADGERISATATAELTLRGVTKVVAIEIEAELDGETVRLAGSVPIVFEEWGIPNPSNPMITTEDHGSMEFLLVLARS